MYWRNGYATPKYLIEVIYCCKFLTKHLRRVFNINLMILFVGINSPEIMFFPG